jgi:hypothetical protein
VRADGGIGVTLAEARKALRERLRSTDGKRTALHSDDTVGRAWGALVETLTRLELVEGSAAAGRSRGVSRPGDPEWC